MAKDNGYQSCLLAPTEILASQHYASISSLLRQMNIKVAFLSGSIKGKARVEILTGLQTGIIDIAIGTHALIEDHVQFYNLGLSIVDEQHRFGVAQRARMWYKTDQLPPHVLVMTATPIPRTLAMTSYGDLDVSIIDELPPGRKPIKTIHRTEFHRPRVIEFMHKEIALGKQIYIVYPLIEESETLDLQDLQQGYEALLQYFPIPQFQISVVHGRMKSSDKDFEMDRFVNKKSQIMVATTVIEVGVNVPNASIMVIENAERFGLSQLHQLRGRVGRGADQSYCILMSGNKLSNDARTRIETMVRTNDGFEIAEADLQLRGPGEIEGTRQSGVSSFKLINLVKDQSIVNTARMIAEQILDKDPKLQDPHNAVLKNYLRSKAKPGTVDWTMIS
jgi:ATP-dependent DNA helicase RecG